MGAIKGRSKRQGSTVTVALTVRVTPNSKAEYEEAAALSGSSLALYLEELSVYLRDTHGSLPVFDHLGRPQWEELPIPAA